MSIASSIHRNNQIDGFRTILCFLIVFFHIFQRYYELRYNVDFSGYFLPNAFAVVSIFFILSGFFTNLSSYKKFWFSKLIGIVIPYVIAITFLLVIQLVSNAHFTFFDIIANYSIIPLLTGAFNYIDGAHWYIVYLLYFFFAVFILDFFENKFHKKRIVSDLLLVTIAFASFSLVFINLDNFIVKALKIVCNSGFLFFVLGIFIKKIINDKKSIFYNCICIILIVLSLIVMAANYGISSFVLWIILFITLYYLLNERIPFFGNKAFVFIGINSLWIYLLHEVSGFLLCDLLISLGIPKLLGSIISFIIVFSFPIPIGIFYKKICGKIFKKRQT